MQWLSINFPVMKHFLQDDIKHTFPGAPWGWGGEGLGGGGGAGESSLFLSDKGRYMHKVQLPVVGRNCTVKTLNIGTPRPATVVVLNIKQFNFTLK